MRVDAGDRCARHARRPEQDAATEEEPCRTEHRDEVGERHPEQSSRLLQQPAGKVVAFVRGFLHRGDAHLLRLADEIEQLPPDRRIAFPGRPRGGHGDAEIVAGPGGEVLPAGVGFQASSLAARAEAAVRHHLHVPELARGARRALIELAGHDDARADVAAHEHDDEVVDAASTADGALAPGGHGQLARDP